ncbi:MAG: 2-C-methyl-D-erythritol 2,4-cyclodiphosphate synthase [Acidobacteriaceae bacterium]
MSMRIGLGYDSHAFKPGVPLVIGGLAIDHPEGLAGHSDGDVLLHAITDALLGAVSAGDIGTFFPPGDPRWKNADSSIFLKTALEEVATAGYRIANIDTVLVLAAPKIVPIAGELRQRVADLLQLRPGDVGIKAKTPEGLNQDGVAVAQAIVLLVPIGTPTDLSKMTATVDAETDIDAVVKSLVAEEPLGTGLQRRMPIYDTEDIT